MVTRYGAGLEGLFDRHPADAGEGALPSGGEQEAVRRAGRRLA
jgi:hypothetical protein